MNKLASVLLPTLVVFPLVAAPAAKKTEIPVGLQSAIEATRHAMEPDGAGFKASNPSQNLELRFDRAAASVRLPDAEVRIRLAGYGRGAQLGQPEGASLAASKNRVEYSRGLLTEWYVNDRAGLEQGFTLAERPRGEGPLVVALAVEGALTPRLESTDAVLLERQAVAMLSYAGLKAWDARGRTLPARMEVQGAEVRLIVEDAGAAYPVTIDPWVQWAKLTASDGAANDHFGSAVALSGDTAIVGALSANAKGAAYVYLRNGNVWTEQAKLTASDGAAGDLFGSAVALSGDTALVGADGWTAWTGAAYVYVRSGTAWTEQARLLASYPLAGVRFGLSVALSGNTALVGALWDATPTGGAGAVYVYVRSGTVWTQQAELFASDGVSSDQFGFAVALSGDTALVGASAKANYTGAAYVYTRSGTVWIQQAKLSLPDGVAGDYFGYSVATSGDTALVGAIDANATGAAYVYARSGTVWTQQAKLTASDGAGSDQFGSSVAVSADTALVGARGKAGFSGAAYVYRRSGTVWTQQAKLVASDGAVNDEFGQSVALRGGTALVGADLKSNFTGAAYAFANLGTTANLTISPSTGSPFTTLTLTGSGFSPNETVGFAYVSTTKVPFGTAVADAGGAFTGTMQFPPAPYGTGLIRAVGQSSGLAGAANFAVTPRLIMNPNAGPAGSSVVAQGFGFGAGETVRIYWWSPQQFLGRATADSTGSFYQATGLTFTIPAAGPAGTNAVWGMGQTTLAIGKGYVTVQ